MHADADSAQFAMFKDSLARRIITKTSMSGDVADTAELEDFTQYLAAEAWPVLPVGLQTLSSFDSNKEDSLALADATSLDSTSTAFIDTLSSCGLCDDSDGALAFLRKVIEDYISEACAPPPVWTKTRTTECEICEREVPLTYHHLIPRETHVKVLKKKWHPEAMLNSVAWLCRPCHSTVHRVATNEQLAREFYTVEKLLDREDLQKWRAYAAKQRFGVRRG